MCDGELPANYNKRDLDVTAGSPVEDIPLELLDDQDEEDCDGTPNDAPLDLEQEHLEQDLTENSKGEKWMISKMENGKMTNIHISLKSSKSSKKVYRKMPRETTLGCQVLTR